MEIELLIILYIILFVVNTQDSVVGLPSLDFLLHERIHAGIPDQDQVFNFAQSVFSAVSFIQMMQAGAGKLISVNTKSTPALSAEFDLTRYPCFWSYRPHITPARARIFLA